MEVEPEGQVGGFISGSSPNENAMAMTPINTPLLQFSISFHRKKERSLLLNLI